MVIPLRKYPLPQHRDRSALSPSPERERRGTTVDPDLHFPTGDIVDSAVVSRVVRLDRGQPDSSLHHPQSVASWIVAGGPDPPPVCVESAVGKAGQDQRRVLPLPIAEHDRRIPAAQSIDGERTRPGPRLLLARLDTAPELIRDQLTVDSRISSVAPAGPSPRQPSLTGSAAIRSPPVVVRQRHRSTGATPQLIYVDNCHVRTTTRPLRLIGWLNDPDELMGGPPRTR